MLLSLAPLLAMTLVATVPAAPDPDGAAPAVARVFVIDGPADGPRWVQWVVPASGPFPREARTETLLVVPRSTTLQVNVFSGDIVVQAWNRNQVHIVARHSRRDRLRPRLENGTLSIDFVNRMGGPTFGDVTVQVPAWMPMRLSGVDSEIDVEGVKAAIEAGSVRGNVVVRQSRGSLQLSSVEGGVRVVDARGRVQVASINNLVHLERVEGLVEAESVNGDIQLSQVDSPDVDASSVNGSVFFDSIFQKRGRYRLASHNGNLNVGVPVGAGVDVSVASFRGGFESGFPVVLDPRVKLQKGRRFAFTLGAGGSSLELESFQGLIQLLRPDKLPVPATAPQAPIPPAPPAAPNQEDDR